MKSAKSAGKMARRAVQAFTLIEMMAVLVIIGLIAALATPGVIGYIQDARVTTAKAQTKLLSDAIDRFNMDQGQYPSESEGLTALVQRPSYAVTWPPGGYLKMTQIPLDPWGMQYEYRLEATADGDTVAKVISYGADKKQGGTGRNADLVNGETINDTGTGATGQTTGSQAMPSGTGGGL